MYPNDLYRDLVADRRRRLVAEADSHRNRQLVARGDGWSIVVVRRSVGTRLVRAGQIVAGQPGGLPPGAADRLDPVPGR